MLSRNNFSKLEIFHTKSNNNNISSKQIRRKSNKSYSNYDTISGANHSIKVITDISQNNLPTITNLTKINNISNKTKHKEIKKQIMDDKFIRYINFGKNLLCKMEKKECNICHKYFDSHLFKIHYNSHPSQIFEWFYLGSFSNACDIKELRKNKINYILNCAIECHNKNLPKDIKELHLKIKDIENFDLINYFEEANEFINKCKLEGGTLLVHCKLGISRSASFVIAYLIKNNNLSVEKALNFVKQKRNQIKPNEGFMSQLKKYERLIYLRKV
jgi:protein-tyrosine phosphatase